MAASVHRILDFRIFRADSALIISRTSKKRLLNTSQKNKRTAHSPPSLTLQSRLSSRVNETMVYGAVKTFQAALKYRGGWRGLIEHMYTVST